jgi:hypothetical protein
MFGERYMGGKSDPTFDEDIRNEMGLTSPDAPPDVKD